MDLDIANWGAGVLSRHLGPRDDLKSISAGGRINTTHDTLLTVLHNAGISTAQPVARIVTMANSSPQLRGTPVVRRLDEEWRQYRKVIYDTNRDTIARCEREKAGWFEEELCGLYLSDLWVNDFWIKYEQKNRSRPLQEFPLLGFTMVRMTIVTPPPSPTSGDRKRATAEKASDEFRKFFLGSLRKARAKLVLRLLSAAHGSAGSLPGGIAKRASAYEKQLQELFEEACKKEIPTSRVYVPGIASEQVYMPSGTVQLPLSYIQKLRGTGGEPPSVRLAREYKVLVDMYGKQHDWTKATYGDLYAMSRALNERGEELVKAHQIELSKVTDNDEYIGILRKFIGSRLGGMSRDLASNTVRQILSLLPALEKSMGECLSASSSNYNEAMEHKRAFTGRLAELRSALVLMEGTVASTDVSRMTPEEMEYLGKLQTEHFDIAVAADVSLQSWTIGIALTKQDDRPDSKQGNYFPGNTATLSEECAKRVQNLLRVIGSVTPNSATAPHTFGALEFEIDIAMDVAKEMGRRVVEGGKQAAARVSAPLQWMADRIAALERDAHTMLDSQLHVREAWSKVLCDDIDIAGIHRVVHECYDASMCSDAATLPRAGDSLLTAVQTLCTRVEYNALPVKAPVI